MKEDGIRTPKVKTMLGLLSNLASGINGDNRGAVISSFSHSTLDRRLFDSVLKEKKMKKEEIIKL